MTHKIFQMPFAKIYDCYLTKLERKGRGQEELDRVIFWLTGYTEQDLEKLRLNQTNLTDFFDKAPALASGWQLIKGRICGQLIEEIDNPLMRKIRCLDKLVDDLAKGKAIEQILP